MRPWEFARCTLTQIAAMLDASDPDDPHAGQHEIRSAAELEEILEDMY